MPNAGDANALAALEIDLEVAAVGELLESHGMIPTPELVHALWEWGSPSMHRYMFEEGGQIKPTAYLVFPDGWEDKDQAWASHHWLLRVENRGHDAWCVTDGFDVFDAHGQSEYEPNPSSREQDFIERTRFDLDSAKALALRLIGTRTVNGYTFKQAKERLEE